MKTFSFLSYQTEWDLFLLKIFWGDTNDWFTCALKACPNNSTSCFAYCSERPVSVAYNTVAFTRRESARPNNFDVNFTALLSNKNSKEKKNRNTNTNTYLRFN